MFWIGLLTTGDLISLEGDSMDSIDDRVARIQAAGHKPDFYGPQQHENVNQLEALFGVNLPPSYRSFLQKHGGGYGLTGLFDNQPDSLHLGCLLGDTQRLREKYPLPTNFIPVRVSPFGGIDALDTSSPNAFGEYPIYPLTIGPDEQLAHRLRTAASFDEYLRELLTDRLEILLEEQEEES